MKKNVLNSDASRPTQTQLPDSGPEVPTSPLVAGGSETPAPKNLSDTELCSHLESEYAPHKKSLKANAPYFAEAKKRFSQQGRRVPVPGRPTYEKWLEGLGLNPRSIRRVVAEYEAALGTTDQIEPAAKSDNSKHNAVTGNNICGSEKKIDGKQHPTQGATYQRTKDLQQLMKCWSKLFSGLDASQRSIQFVGFVQSLPVQDRADLFDALHITMNPVSEPSVGSRSRIPGVSRATAVQQEQSEETINTATDASQKTWSTSTTTVAASGALSAHPKANSVPKDSSLRSLVREMDKEELDRERSWNQ